MKNTLTYRRVDKAIMTAFIKLLRDIPFEKLTVHDILEEALVSRYTFYAHFHDKYELAERLQQEVIQDYQSFIKDEVQKVEAAGLPRGEHHKSIDKVSVEFFTRNSDKLLALRSIRTESVDYRNVMKQLFTQNYKCLSPNEEYHDLERSIYAGIMLSVSEYFEKAQSLSYSEPLMHSSIYVFLQMIGIHDKERVSNAVKYLTNLARGDKQ